MIIPKKSRIPDNGRDKIHLRQSVLYIVMMASDGLQYLIEIVDYAIDVNEVEPNEIFYSPSSSVVSVPATFYG